jgi:two-component SAPR family response regulator
MGLEDLFQEIGAVVAGPFSSCVAGLAWVNRNTPDLAILDFKLMDGPCTDLAKVLLARDVPIIIYSGYPRGVEPELEGVTWLEKPIDRPSLLHAVIRLAPTLTRRVDITALSRGHYSTAL